MGKTKGINVVKNFGGRRAPANGPASVADWGTWDCDPIKTGSPNGNHAFGREFPWTFDKEEKAYILEGSATLTPDDADKYGDPVTIEPRDMVTFPRGWSGSWTVHEFFKKRYAFFDGKGNRVEEDDTDAVSGVSGAKAPPAKRQKKAAKVEEPPDEADLEGEYDDEANDGGDRGDGEEDSDAGEGEYDD